MMTRRLMVMVPKTHAEEPVGWSLDSTHSLSIPLPSLEKQYILYIASVQSRSS